MLLPAYKFYIIHDAAVTWFFSVSDSEVLFSSFVTARSFRVGCERQSTSVFRANLRSWGGRKYRSRHHHIHPHCPRPRLRSDSHIHAYQHRPHILSYEVQGQPNEWRHCSLWTIGPVSCWFYLSENTRSCICLLYTFTFSKATSSNSNLPFFFFVFIVMIPLFVTSVRLPHLLVHLVCFLVDQFDRTCYHSAFLLFSLIHFVWNFLR